MTVAVSLLTVSTVRVDDPGPLLALLPEHGALAWVSDGDGLVGWGEAARVELSGPDRFAEAEQWWDEVVAASVVTDDVGLPGSGLVAFGSFAFDPLAASSVLAVPQVVVGHREGTWWITRATVAGEPALGAEGVTAVRPPCGLRVADDDAAGAVWERAVAGAVRRIEAGELDKVVLAREVPVRLDEPLDVRWPLQRLATGYPACWTFSVEGLIGATPEVLVRLRDGVATSRVLAGTLRRSGDANEDARRGDAFARSIKDIEEHGYALRSVADALALHASAVEVPEDPFVLELPNVLHLASDVTATVRPGTSSLSLLASLHPSAAVCGTPTDVAMAVVREVEGLQRGRYTGPVGWTDASGDGEWGIALRCAEIDPDDRRRLRLFAGGGIVSGSKPADELAETAAKLLPMREALQP